jgi:hypothetical protein
MALQEDPGEVFDEQHNPCWCCPCHNVYPCPGGPATNAEWAAEHDDDDYVVVSGQGGHSKTPWQLRGVQLPKNEKYFAWEAAWPTLAAHHNKMDVCQVAANFYLLDALRSGLINREHECSDRPCRHFELWNQDLSVERREADSRYADLVELLDVVFSEYVEMACGGELRHHNACGGGCLSQHRRTAWADWKWIHEQLGHQALLDGAEMFDQFPGGAFGGAKWAHALRLLHKRLTNQISAITYVDQVFTLVHNGGVFLNKLDWAVRNDLQWNLHYLQAKVLPAQEADAWTLLLKVADKETRQLWDRYWRHSNKARVSMAVPPSVNIRSNPRRRTICASCASNPRVGHTMRCQWFIKGLLADGLKEGMTRTIAEEDWEAEHWHTWESTLMPVGPRGEVIILPALTYKIIVETHSSDAAKTRTFSGTGLELMKTTMKFTRAVPTVPGWEANEDTEYWFVVQVLDARGRTRLGAFESRHTTNLQAFKEKYITFGHILPLVLDEIDWSHVQKELV